MPPSTLYIDSRYRTRGSTRSSPSFNLIRPIINVHTASVRSLQFVNTFYNLTVDNNTLLTSSGAVTVTEGFYSGIDFVLALDAELVTVFGAGSYATFNSIYNQVNWVLGGGNTISGTSTMSSLLGLENTSPVLTGTFWSTLHIARPSYISFSCNQLQPVSNRTHHAHDTDAKDNVQPCVIVPVTSGFLEAQTHQPVTPPTIILDRGAGVSISRLSFTVRDSATARELTEMADWAAVIEFD